MGIRGPWSVRNYMTTLRTLLLPPPPPLPTPNSFFSSSYSQCRGFSHELVSRILPVSLSGLLWPLECWTQTPSSLPSWLPSINTFKIALPPRLSPPEDQSPETPISLWVPALAAARPAPQGSKISLASPSSPWVMLTLPTSASARDATLTSHKLATLTAQSVDLMDLMWLAL